MPGSAGIRWTGRSLGRFLWEGPVQEATEGGGVGEAVHEEVEGGEADEGPAEGRDTGEDEDGAGEGDDAEKSVGAQERGWVFAWAIGVERRDEVAVEAAGEAPAGCDGAGGEHQDDERDEPGGGLDPGHDEGEAKASGHDKLVEAAFAAISHGLTPAAAGGQGPVGGSGRADSSRMRGGKRVATACQPLSALRPGCQTLSMRDYASDIRSLQDAW